MESDQEHDPWESGDISQNLIGSSVRKKLYQSSDAVLQSFIGKLIMVTSSASNATVIKTKG